jgi:hypothetical protein
MKPAFFPRIARILAVAGMVLIASAHARAADTILTFDDLNPDPALGLALGNQYLSEGIRFESGYAVSYLQALTVPNVAEGFRSGELGSPYIRGVFTNPHHAFVTVEVENNVAAPITMTLFDPGGNLISTTTANRSASPGTFFPMTLTTSQRNIAAFAITGNPGGPATVIDNLRFDDIGTLQGPDFYFYPVGGYQVLPAGGPPQNITVNLGRLANSTGGVTLSVSGLPAGISVASITPNPVTGNSAQIALKASSGAAIGAIQRFIITGTPSATAGAYGPRSISASLSVTGSYDAQIVGIEVTQGIQPYDLPQRDPANPNAPVSYNQNGRAGVPLAQGGTTVARVFTTLRSPATAPVPGTNVVLYGYRLGPPGTDPIPLPGSPLQSVNFDYSSPTVVSDTVTDDLRSEKTKNGTAWFVLPNDPKFVNEWAMGTIMLRAEISQPLSFTPPTAFDCCSDNNQFTLTDIAFTPTRDFWVAPFRLDVQGMTVDPPSLVFDGLKTVTPVSKQQFHAFGWDGIIDITDIWNQTKKACGFLGLDSCDEDDVGRGDSAAARVRSMADDLNYTDSSDFVVGVFPEDDSTEQRMRAVTNRACTGPFWDCDALSVSVVQHKDRPLSSVAHEVGHLMGREHASAACGGGANGQVGEDWPPDQQGFLQGVGVDLRTNAVLFPPRDGTNPYYDFMSYCGTNGSGDPDHWISVKGWNEEMAVLAAGQPGEIKLPFLKKPADTIRPLQAAPAIMIVRAIAHQDGYIEIVKVGPGNPAHPVAPDPASPYHLVAKDSDGNVLFDEGMKVDDIHIHGAAEDSFLTVTAPADGIASVEIVKDSQTVAMKAASANLPVVSDLSVEVDAIRAGARLSRATWTAIDADGDPLTAKVDYSADGGATWRPIYLGPNQDGADLPAELLSTSSQGMIAVRVSDGFHETRVTSDPFATGGTRPVVEIISPSPKERFRSGSAITLSGDAQDDSKNPIPGDSLIWSDQNGQALGSGKSLMLSGVAPGTHSYTLTATDAQGRVRSQSVTIQVDRVAPE